MSVEIQTPFGDPLPPFPSHSITTHMPKWETILKFIDNPNDLITGVKSLYPRLGPFGFVKELTFKVSVDCLDEGQACLLFASKDSAEACRNFLLSEKRGENQSKDTDIKIRVFDFRVRIWATTFPAANMGAAIPYWQDPGTGISSRLAKDCLEHYDQRKEVRYESDGNSGLSMDDNAFAIVRKRIADLLNRAPVAKRKAGVDSNDVFLYPTGMAAIYRLHQYLQRSFEGSTVLFGFAFHSTPLVYKEFSHSFKWFGRGDAEELKQLEAFCEAEVEAGRQIQAVWVEFPSNPNIRTPDLMQLRTLADKFGFLLIVDDTVSSLCNVDLLGVADLVVTSLTKSFSGYSNVMAGSMVVNPNLERYEQLKDMCNRNFVNELFAHDAEALERNSQDFLERSSKLNQNAFAVAQYLQHCSENSSSSVAAVACPAFGSDSSLYIPFLRPETSEFTPGCGCLLSVEFESTETTVAFYDNLHVHQGPHLGANLTLALAYVKALHAKEVEWVQQCGMNGRMIRISVGLEDTEKLVQTFRTAVEAADAVKAKDPLDKAVHPLRSA